jgi:protein gp37
MRSGEIIPRNRTSEGTWRKPYQWNAKGKEFKSVHGRRQRAFCASMADVFDNQVPIEWRHDLFELIRDCKRLVWLLLTKRSQNIQKMLPTDWGDGYGNVSFCSASLPSFGSFPTNRQSVRCGCRDTALCRTG